MPPGTQSVVRIVPGALFTVAQALILPGDEIYVKDIFIYTDAVGDTSRVSQSGGDLRLSGDLIIESDLESGIANYQLSGGSIGAAAVVVGSEGLFDATFTQTGGISRMSQLEVGRALNLFAGESFYQLAAGIVEATSAHIGSNTAASFIQGGGENRVTNIVLGGNETGDGSYTLSVGFLVAASEVIGSRGRGTFDQTGGDNSVTTQLLLGGQSTGEGIYTLTDGVMSAPSQFIGDLGTGIFSHNGGNNTASDKLILGNDPGSEGIYTLNGGTLTVNRIESGQGSGTLNLNGGALDLTGPSIDVNLLNIGGAAGSNGELNLGAGELLTSDSLFVGRGGTGNINQSGGTTTINGDLIMGYYSEDTSDYSAYTLRDGNLVAQNLFLNRCFPYSQFIQAGGTATIGQTLTLAQFCGTADYFLFDGTLVVGDIVNGTGSGNIYMRGGTLRAESIHAEDMTTFEFTGGTLMVDQFLGMLNSQGGTLSPGATPSSPTSSNITGNYTQSVTSRLQMELRGTGVFESDTLVINGTANLAGELQAVWVDGPGENAVEGDSLDLLTAETINGFFDVVNLPAPAPGLGLVVNVLTDEIGSTDVVRLSVVGIAAFTVGGTVSGLQLPGLVLELDNGSLLLFEKDGVYTFSTGLTDGTAYSVTAPLLPDDHDCSIANATGSIAGADVLDVNVVCTTDIEFADGFETLSEIPTDLD